jgi:hypothetical protein
LLSSRGIITPSLPAQGEQRRFSFFNIRRGIPRSAVAAWVVANLMITHTNADRGAERLPAFIPSQTSWGLD